MAEASKTLWDKAALAITAGDQNRLSMVSAGKTVELGDTGVRNLSGLLTNTTAGTVYAQRVGEVVTITLEGVITTGTGNLIVVPASVAGMRSMAPTSRTVWAALFTTAGVARCGIGANGALYVHNPYAGQAVSGVLTFATSEDWFNASRPLPGVAFGEPVGV